MTATLTEFAELVSSIMTAGVPRAKAEMAARRKLGMPANDASNDRDANVLEKAEQTAIVKLFREHGFTVRSTSQARASKIAIGFPDLFVTHRTRPIAFFFESKRQVGGVMSDAQQDFARDCLRCGVRWYCGDRYDAQCVCDEHQIARPG